MIAAAVTLDVLRTFILRWLMVLSFRDRRTADFGAGKEVKAFSGFRLAARSKLDRLETALSITELAALGGNRFEALRVIAKGSTAFASMTSGEFASHGPRDKEDRRMWRLLTIARRFHGV
jgi:plasmid maintenance system killer protein